MVSINFSWGPVQFETALMESLSSYTSLYTVSPIPLSSVLVGFWHTCHFFIPEMRKLVNSRDQTQSSSEKYFKSTASVGAFAILAEELFSWARTSTVINP